MTRQTIPEFIKKNEIASTWKKVDANPNMEGSDEMDNYKVTLRFGGSRMVVPFSKGFGHKGEPPTADEVLNALALDSSGVENNSTFEDWCSEYGYDVDSRKAARTYKACVNQAARLKKLLGDDLYNKLLWETESL